MDCIVHGVTKSRTRLRDFPSLSHSLTHSHSGDKESGVCRSACSMKVESAYALFLVTYSA